MNQRQTPTLEEQLRILEECGIRLLPGKTVDDLLAARDDLSRDRAAFEAEPFRLAVVALGVGEWQDERLSEDVWHFDFEFIEDHGDYEIIARRMRDLAQGSLPITAITDYVDIEEETAWLQFELEGQTIRWEAEVDNDWADATIFSRFAELLAGRGSDRRYTYLDLKGQDCIIGCTTAGQLAALREKTGLDFQWLS
jgi:hypothetical protein